MTNESSYKLAELALSPEGHVYLYENAQASSQLPTQEFEKIKRSFDKDPRTALLYLGIQEFHIPLPASFLFWQSFSRKFVVQVCKSTHAYENQDLPNIPVPDPEELQEIINRALLIKGFEYLSRDILERIWKGLESSLKQELLFFSGNVQAFLAHYNPRWNLVGRVCFHLAENKKDAEKPFAFLATYTTQLSKGGSAQHLPLKRALQDYAGEKNHNALLALLLPVQKAANQSSFIKNLVDTGAIFQPQIWSAREAHSFLKEIPLMESSGVMVRIPNWWSAQKPPRPKVDVKIGESQVSMMGLNTLLDFDIRLTLGNGEQLSNEEWQALLNSKESLVKIKGQWVEVDHEKLNEVLSHWKNIQKASKNGLSMAESLRLLAGGGSGLLNGSEPAEKESIDGWSTVAAGNWLNTVLDQLRNPSSSEAISSTETQLDQVLEIHLKAVLRPYQLTGVRWLWLLYQLKLGGCLADDMGLGKTIQVLSLLLAVKHHPSAHKGARKPHLLIVPASLLGNWQAEAKRFAPSLTILVAHPSGNERDVFSNISAEQLVSYDIVLTTYALIHRLGWLKEAEWDLVILDEAQQIKNPGTKQTKAVKELKSQIRISLTGTPIENRLSDLWSLFDFTSPGLLGTGKAFSTYSKKAGSDNTSAHYTRFIVTLRTLTQPYILRRLKTDKKIISDLPDKTEMQTYCSLSKDQIRLYQEAIQELVKKLKEAAGIERLGLVLSYLIRFKQICNHPTQWSGVGDYAAEASGKFMRLQEICEEIAAKQEKVLIFTQFKEIIPALSSFLANVFGREGLTLHGDTAINKRAELVASFQQEQGPPFFVLSLKAGGIGLNLTRASHVIHFDRWWNPAVENQATDRAYRIGQKNPVLVHKFICSGTIEDKIDALITSKKNISKKMLEGGNELLLTELSNEELIEMVSLDLQKAMGDF